MWERLEADLRAANQRIAELENALNPLLVFDYDNGDPAALKRLVARATLIMERKAI